MKMEQLAKLEDLPTSYVANLTQNNLVPLWPSLRNVLPPLKPIPHTQATFWKFNDIKHLLIEAGELKTKVPYKDLVDTSFSKSE